MWGREVEGTTLTFHLAGINNQNFIMRDEQTGTYWQQIDGVAISGPLARKRLRLISSDELTFSMWKAEEPRGTVLADDPRYVSGYAARDWDVRMRKTPTVLSHAQPGLAARDLMLTVHAFGASRAFPFDAVRKEQLINDHVGAERVTIVVGPDGESVRVFRARTPGSGKSLEFYRIAGGTATGPLMIDNVTGSTWNFQGCALDGSAKGACLERVEAMKDYWFDWREYNPDTTVYRSR